MTREELIAAYEERLAEPLASHHREQLVARLAALRAGTVADETLARLASAEAARRAKRGGV